MKLFPSCSGDKLNSAFQLPAHPTLQVGWSVREPQGTFGVCTLTHSHSELSGQDRSCCCSRGVHGHQNSRNKDSCAFGAPEPRDWDPPTCTELCLQNCRFGEKPQGQDSFSSCLIECKAPDWVSESLVEISVSKGKMRTIPTISLHFLKTKSTQCILPSAFNCAWITSNLAELLNKLWFNKYPEELLNWDSQSVR